MSTHEERGVSYREVWYWLDELERTHHCHCHFQVWPVRKEGLGPKWSVRLEAKWLGVGGAVLKERGESAAFPHSDYSSLPGCMVTLIYRLDARITEEQKEADELRATPLRFG